MLKEQVIPVNFGQGVDTKADPKLVVAGKMLRLENGVFTAPGRITKRNGYQSLSNVITGIGNILNPKLVHSLSRELLCQDQGMFLSFSPERNAWNYKGPYTSTELTRETVDQSFSDSGYVDSVVLGNYALYIWSTASQQNPAYPIVNANVFASVVDLTTGDNLGKQVISTTPIAMNYPRAVLLGGTKLAVLYIDPANQIVIRLVTFGGGGTVTFGVPIVVSTNYNAWSFDVVQTATGCAIVYQSTTGVTVSTINMSGAVVNTQNIVDATASAPFSISVTSNNNIWIYWYQSTRAGPNLASGNIRVAVFTAILGAVLVPTTVAAMATPYIVTNMIAISTSATQQALYFGQYVAAGAGGGFVDASYYAVVNDGGVIVAPVLYANGVAPYSRPITLTSSGVVNSYAVFVYRGLQNIALNVALPSPLLSFPQPTYFMLQLTGQPLAAFPPAIPVTVARFGSGQANNQAVLEIAIAYTPNLSPVSATEVLFSCGVETQEFNSDFYSTAQPSPGGLSGAFAYFIDFNGENAYRAVNSGELAVLNGGMMSCYDGQNCAEFGFHLFPELINVVDNASGSGFVANGVYGYLAIFQWTDAQGNLHQSAPSLATIHTKAGGDSIRLDISTAYLSQKPGVSVAIYRTQNAGNVYFLVSDPLFLQPASPGVAAVTFVDNLADASIQGNPQAYTYPASAVLENSTPPPSTIALAHNNRLWFVNAESRNEIWYTKSFQKGFGLSPSALMLEQLDPKFGPCVALEEMDDKIVFFKETGFFAQSGDGVNDTGSGSTLSFPQMVPSDVGASSLKGVIKFPGGIIFKTINGIYLVDRALGVSYLGMPVEGYNNETITAASIVPTKSQIRFLVSSGLTLVYDYIFNQWSTFTNHTGTSSTAWNGVYVYANSNGKIFKEVSGFYNDDSSAFSLLAQTSWLALAGVQGFERVRRLAMLGDFTNGASANHKLSIAAAYNFSPTFQPAVDYTFGLAAASGVFQYRERLPIQKCDTISLLIQEVTTGSSTEYVDLTNISFEAAIKRGVAKLSAAQSVG